MTRSIRKMVVVGLCVVVALFVASPIQGKDKVKLTGAELKGLTKPGAIVFYTNHRSKNVGIIEVLENGDQKLYWRKSSTIWGTDIGTLEIVGDQMCSKMTFGPKSCFDVYRVGEDKYESYLGEELLVTGYRGQRAYETRKDKVKLTESELKERESQYGVYAGVNQRRGSVHIVIRPSSGKRELYWRSLRKPGLSGAFTGTARIDEDQSCTKWTYGPERCTDFYRIGEDKYEIWIDGSIDSMNYKLK
jgi:hypothetical protein